MKSKAVESFNIFWFRRDLRIHDNRGLFEALSAGLPVQPIFIFDTEILEKLKDPFDLRVQFIYQEVLQIKQKLQELGSDVWIFHGKPLKIYEELLGKFAIGQVFANHDYEPGAIARDRAVGELLQKHGAEFLTFKDQVIFEKNEVLTGEGKPYTVFTPYKNKWLSQLSAQNVKPFPSEKKVEALRESTRTKMPLLTDLGFQEKVFTYPDRKIIPSVLKTYEETRNFPALKNGTSRLGLHLRFGTISVREAVAAGHKHSPIWLSELIWREFFMQTLWHNPRVVKESFRKEYEDVPWRDVQSEAKDDFARWCAGETGYPMVDAGMRELNQTGYMHNRVRMVVASFLAKHLLIHWYHGERYFAEKLLDYELSANNGNWQWAAGTGCDAAPYFRVFNPEAQVKKFDAKQEYLKKWIPELGTKKYPAPIVDHNFARGRALRLYGEGLQKSKRGQK